MDDPQQRYWTLMIKMNWYKVKYHLDPMRIVNRALYGTDYDPADVSLRSNALSVQDEIILGINPYSVGY